MKRMFSVVFLLVGVTVLCWPERSSAQKIKDLTNHEPTTEELIEGLKPRGTGSSSQRMRGIDLTGQPAAANCEQYRQKAKAMTRGVEPVADGHGISLTVTFAFDSAELTPEATRTLDKLGEALQSDTLASSCFQIEGHTDNIGSEPYNLTLSQLRAQSVVQYLSTRYNLQERTIPIGYGEQQPIADNDTPEGRQKNRRVQIVNVGSGN
ncbi:MAG: OmpA family protein [Candidatus Binatia bacterium]